MSQERAECWFGLNENQMKYFLNQFENPYRSTILFCDWLEANPAFYGTKSIVDIGCGMGETLAYMARRFPNIEFVGIDFNKSLIESGKVLFSNVGINNVKLEHGDLFNLSENLRNRFDGLLSLQTLSWLADFREPLKKMAQLNCRWMALSSLFYDGPVSAQTRITDRSSGQAVESFYNTYAIPDLREELKNSGYAEMTFKPYDIDIDLAKPVHGGMGTYTRKDENAKRMQISGPLWMNWHFMFAEQSRHPQ